MIKITKELLEGMYAESDNQEAMIDRDKFANTIVMKKEYDDGDTLEINVFSHFIDQSKKYELIQIGETDSDKIFEESSFVEDKYTIDTEDNYVLEADAKQYLKNLHEEFSKDMKENDIETIEREVENYESHLNKESIVNRQTRKLRL